MKVRHVEPTSNPPNSVLQNAVMMLNEMFPPPGAAQYRVLAMSGASNSPSFTLACCLLGREFEGTGRSKKEAKLAASQLALSTLFGKEFGAAEEVAPTPRVLADTDAWLELEGRNPVSVLNELHPEATFQLVAASGPSHAPQFVIRAALGALAFEGRAISKREAKLAASKALLRHLHGVTYHPMTGGIRQAEAAGEAEAWGDTVAGLVREQFEQAVGGTTFTRRKVLAGVVLKWRGETSVVAVATGTKCINGERLCLDGSVVNDCHAEVVARRCVLLWLYDQLLLALAGQSSVLQRCPAGGWTLDPAASLHMFISTAPCGDARIFSHHESTGGRGGAGRGKLRSKIESGMGTVPLPEGGRQQTWDGVLSGDRLLTMACRWGGLVVLWSRGLMVWWSRGVVVWWSGGLVVW